MNVIAGGQADQDVGAQNFPGAQGGNV